MQCAEFESRLHDLLDARVAPEDDRQLLEHCADCSQCSQMLRAQQLLLTGLDAFEPPTLSREFDQQAVRRAQRPARKLPSSAVAIAALAATVLVAAAALSGSFRGKANSVDQPTAVRQRPPAAQGPLMVASRDLNDRQGGADSPSANEDLTSQEYRQLLHGLLEDLPAATENLPAVDHLAGGLRPIASSFTAAFDALRRTIPGAKSNSRPEKPQAGAFSSFWSKFAA